MTIKLLLTHPLKLGVLNPELDEGPKLAQVCLLANFFISKTEHNCKPTSRLAIPILYVGLLLNKHVEYRA